MAYIYLFSYRTNRWQNLQRERKWCNHIVPTTRPGLRTVRLPYIFIFGLPCKYMGCRIRIQIPPCAVCQVQRSTSIMIPAKRNCPVGWVKEYTGMLIGAWEGEYASDYICLDENPEFLEGTRSHNDNGRTLYPVRARCGSLPCPPYVDYHYISCVVCSQ